MRNESIVESLEREATSCVAPRQKVAYYGSQDSVLSLASSRLGSDQTRRRHDGGCRLARRPLKVTITYCAECGYEPQALGLAEVLMKALGHQLSSIELIPWHEGSFEVAVDGKLVHSMYRDGGFPEQATILAAVQAVQEENSRS